MILRFGHDGDLTGLHYHTLVATIPGQMVIAVCLAAVFVSFAFVVKLTQPIEYRR